MGDEGSKIPELLRELSEGKPGALDCLIPVVYDELRRIAHGQLHGERAHCFAIAARVMRRVLIDYARIRSRDKRAAVLS